MCPSRRDWNLNLRMSLYQQVEQSKILALLERRPPHLPVEVHISPKKPAIQSRKIFRRLHTALPFSRCSSPPSLDHPVPQGGLWAPERNFHTSVRIQQEKSATKPIQKINILLSIRIRNVNINRDNCSFHMCLQWLTRTFEPISPKPADQLFLVPKTHDLMGSFAPLLSSGVGTRPHFGELKWTCLTLAHLRQ